MLDETFRDTSLHLFFTEYIQGISASTTGGKEVEAYFHERFVSFDDRINKITGQDVLSTIQGGR